MDAEYNNDLEALNCVFVESGVSDADINKFVLKNVNSVGVLYISVANLEAELRNHVNDCDLDVFFERAMLFNKFFFANISTSAELINAIAEYLYCEHEYSDKDSFLYAAYHYSIPVFIIDIDNIQNLVPDVFSGDMGDAFVYRYINQEYSVIKYRLIRTGYTRSLIGRLVNMGTFRNLGHQSVNSDDSVRDTGRTKYLFDELIGK